ncbi:hypothetical protein GCM10010989_29190 [Croceicoccus pelagius]|uniref:Uncharacterized protein n=1 Tax=Croceicoccus pelagius TaxID=1703341 RepID=A0A916YN28_9SPHN|nr:hypothetical protein GCM10010989_29190 [Croceicoccus pelagius]
MRCDDEVEPVVCQNISDKAIEKDLCRGQPRIEVRVIEDRPPFVAEQRLVMSALPDDRGNLDRTRDRAPCRIHHACIHKALPVLGSTYEDQIEMAKPSLESDRAITEAMGDVKDGRAMPRQLPEQGAGSLGAENDVALPQSVRPEHQTYNLA